MASKALDALEWINSDPSRMLQVERWIISGALHNYDFWLSVSDRVCIDPENDKDIDDFETLEHNIIFIGIRKYWNLNIGDSINSESLKPDPSVFKEFLELEAAQGNICSEDEIPKAIGVYEDIIKNESAGVSSSIIANKFLSVWLSKRRARYIGNASKRMTLEDMIVSGERHSDIVSSISSSDSSIILYGDHPRYEEESSDIHLDTLPELYTSLGGLFRGDAYMFHSPTGGGKTVMAVQLLVDLINKDQVGLFISTEQPWKEIEPRVISNACSINIGQDSMRNRFNYKAAIKDKSSINYINEWERKAKNKFVFFHWNTDNTQSVRTDLEATLRKGKILLGRDPDFVILDWIGGALGSEINSDNLRFAYQNTADAFASACLKHNFIGIAFAQSKADKTYYTLSSEHLAECKTMHRKFNALIGITAIPVQEDRDQKESKSKFELRQFMDVSKARKGNPARLAVAREFQFQRFKESRQKG